MQPCWPLPIGAQRELGPRRPESPEEPARICLARMPAGSARESRKAITVKFFSFAYHVSFVFRQLAWNRSHVIHSIYSYSYLSLPVGLNWPIWALLAAQSVDLFYVRHLPTLVLGCLLRAIEAEPRKPVLTLGGIDPVRLFTGRRFRAKVDVHRTIWVLLHPLVRGGDDEPVSIAEEGRCRHVVHGDRPELLHRNIRGNMQLVVIPSLEGRTSTVEVGSEIETAPAKL